MLLEIINQGRSAALDPKNIRLRLAGGQFIPTTATVEKSVIMAGNG